MNEQHWRELKAWIGEEAVKAAEASNHWRFMAMRDVGNLMCKIETEVYSQSLAQAGY